MSCWEVLGLSEDADKRSIKRQYASLLKRHRPDDDPEGFQKLRQAYEQALEWAQWQPEAPTLSQLPAPLDDVQAPPPVPPHPLERPSPAQRLAEQCLEGVDAANLADRLAQARLQGCERAFEHGLLQRCLPDEDNYALAEAAIEQLHWLTPWQREDLPHAATEHLRSRLMDHACSRLTEVLHDTQRFLDLARQLAASPWLQTLDARQWLNQSLAMILLQAPDWSERLFEGVCAQQGWRLSGHHSACPEPWWSQLLAQSQCATFVQNQVRLTQFYDSSASQAARMLFGSLDEDARVRLSITFSAADWDACEELYRTVQLRHPQLLYQMPQLAPDNWRPLRRRPPAVAVPAAIVGASACMSWLLEYRLGGSFYISVIDLLLRALFLGAVAWALNAGCKMLSRAWRLDQWLHERYGHWLSFRRPAPLPIRESLWVGLLGGVIYMAGGLAGSATYFGILATSAIMSRGATSKRIASLYSRLYERLPDDVLVGLFLGILIPLVLLGNTFAGNAPLAANEGLQAWPQRTCVARQLTTTPCPVQLSARQWHVPKTSQADQP
ncbi:J domain-containing protein [Pseudomonas sp. Pf153]|uniref:J domain-containing protein n=1 Tax=Pseudomonas sp. Pf153 TaxID=1699309 RepID=UPI00069E88AE|nr:J domain-containing protein [Pseudomonas sp. Pf153]